MKHLKQYFNQGKRTKLEQLKIFRLIFIKVKRLVGESGCGKSTTGKAIIKLNDILVEKLFMMVRIYIIFVNAKIC